jgi:outer membrane protein assembly factor BamA
MTKLGLYTVMVLCFMLLNEQASFAQYPLQVRCVDRDSVFDQKNLGLQRVFPSRQACLDYVYKLPSLLQAKGFATASVDSVHSDSLGAFVHLYIGDVYVWGRIFTARQDAAILSASGWTDRRLASHQFNYPQLQSAQQQILNYLENNGYPFARISLDSIQLESGRLSAHLKIDRGPLYHIDSIRVYGSAKISTEFLQRYLNIPNGSLYRKDHLEVIDKKIMELPYVQEDRSWTITLLGSGSILNLYLKPRKASQIDAIVGLLPNNSQLPNNGLLVTGEATIRLQNAFGNGENIGLNWQQLQVKSPQLNLDFAQPFIFKSPYGLNFSFDLFKKDSSYLNVNAILGLQYITSTTKSGSIFFEASSSNLLTVDTQEVIATHQLPSQADVSSVGLGVNYQMSNTNYRFNPLRGNEFLVTAYIGTKTIKKDNTIVQLVDPSDSSFSFNSLYDTLQLHTYELRLLLSAAHYQQLGRASTLKFAFNGGIFQSPSAFRNEVYQIGGYKLLRGFDEQSILASQYVVGTVEYRYLIAQNSFLFTFVDLGWAKNNIPGYSMNSTYLGFGVGLAFQTKAGIFNMSYALGKSSETDLSLREAKIHLGYATFF